ncbi:MAG: copper homeostasis protein CutC [Bacteroidetes bacterium]|nr:copper homeostasis protein CutC [Bacteroidota bacterium]
MIIEICANGFESARIAQEAGAHRIELCIDLSVGGLTPSYELIHKVKEELAIETHVLIRPRSGNFCYSEEELNGMISDIIYCKQLGCAGVVSGVLTSDNELDITATKRLISAAQDMEFTFHRAIDIAKAPRQALREMILMGVTRVLSSGQEAKAIDGIELLKTFLKDVDTSFQIMPGGGITSSNVLTFKEVGFNMVHLSAIKKNMHASQDLFNSDVQGVSDAAEIQRVIQLLSN